MNLFFGAESLIAHLRPSVVTDVWNLQPGQYRVNEAYYWETLFAKALSEAGALWVSDLPYRLAGLNPAEQESVIRLACQQDVQDYLYKKVAPLLQEVSVYRYEGWRITVGRTGRVVLNQ